MTKPSKPTSKSAQIRKLLEGGAAPADIAKQVGCSLPLVYQVRTKMRGGGGKTAPKQRARATGAARKGTNMTDQLAQLSDIAAAVKNVEQDRTRLRATLEKIQTMIADALA
ncbi:MAG: hypothetical protein NXI31_13630 [bacterium]|nr:hypothetical protein [bacterium]